MTDVCARAEPSSPGAARTDQRRLPGFDVVAGMCAADDDVLECRHGRNGRMFWNVHGPSRLQLRACGEPRRRPPSRIRPGAAAIDARQNIQRGCLAGTVGPYQRVHLTATH